MTQGLFVNHKDKRRIVILGGTVEGYMTAWAICQQYGKERFDVVVLDFGADENEAALSLQGESLPILARFGLNEKMLAENLSSTCKLGTRFVNWCMQDDETIQPIGTHGGPMDLVPFHNFAAKKRKSNPSLDYNDYSLGASAAMAGKFVHPQTNPGSILATLLYSLHLDSGQFTTWLKRLCVDRGVVTREVAIDDVALSRENNRVSALVLDDGESLDVDLVVDCFGGARNPFAEALSIGFEGWESHLPTDRVMSFSRPADEGCKPLTTVTAHEEGLVIESPLASSVRGDFYFSRKALGDEQAVEFLQRVVPECEIPGPARAFEPGIRDAAWIGNYVALGPAYGRYEPLDASNFHGFLVALERFFDLFPRSDDSALEAHEFNRKTRLWYENMRDFNLIRVVALRLSDVDENKLGELPQSFRHKFELFVKTAQPAYFEEEPFPEPYRVSAFINMGFWPRSYHPLVEKFDFDRLDQRFEEMKRLIADSVSRMSNHLDYTRRLLASQ